MHGMHGAEVCRHKAAIPHSGGGGGVPASVFPCRSDAAGRAREIFLLPHLTFILCLLYVSGYPGYVTRQEVGYLFADGTSKQDAMRIRLHNSVFVSARGPSYIPHNIKRGTFELAGGSCGRPGTWHNFLLVGLPARVLDNLVVVLT